MKQEWMITFRSVTYAQRAERILRNHRILSRIQRTPKYLTERGCGYCLRLQSKDVSMAMQILHREKLSYEKLYVLKEDGSTEEQTL